MAARRLMAQGGHADLGSAPSLLPEALQTASEIKHWSGSIRQGMEPEGPSPVVRARQRSAHPSGVSGVAAGEQRANSSP